MSFVQALLIGIFAYLGRNQVPWLFGTTGGFYALLTLAHFGNTLIVSF